MVEPEPVAEGASAQRVARALRYPWSQRRGRRVSWRLRVARARSVGASPSERRELVAAALRACGVLGLTALVRAEIDADGDVVVRDLDGVPVAMVRPALDGSITRVF